MGKEFSMLSGWPKEVLLGERPNLNTNIPHAKSDAAEIAKKRRRGTYGGNGSSDDNDNKDDDDDGTTGGDSVARPRPSNTPKPVFLLELLDDESVCEFYEDFSKLAFADSTGKVTRKCKILKYKPPPTPPPPTSQIGSEVAEEMGVSGDGNNEGGRTNGAQQKDGGKSAKRKYPQGQSPLDILGSSTTIECMMCWTLRRDVFGIPMLIILNVSLLG